MLSLDCLKKDGIIHLRSPLNHSHIYIHIHYRPKQCEAHANAWKGKGWRQERENSNFPVYSHGGIKTAFQWIIFVYDKKEEANKAQQDDSQAVIDSKLVSLWC